MIMKQVSIVYLSASIHDRKSIRSNLLKEKCLWKYYTLQSFIKHWHTILKWIIKHQCHNKKGNFFQYTNQRKLASHKKGLYSFRTKQGLKISISFWYCLPSIRGCTITFIQSRLQIYSWFLCTCSPLLTRKGTAFLSWQYDNHFGKNGCFFI